MLTDKKSKEKHFRVDKMKNLKVLDQDRVGMEIFKDYDLAAFAKMSFGMFSGEHAGITLEFHESMVGVLIDRFGKDIIILPTKEEGWFETNVEVAVSRQFYGWLYALGTSVKITGPDRVVKEWKKQLKDMNDFYKE